MNYDEIPEWIRTATPYSDDLTVDGLLDVLNYLKGTYVGYSMKIADQQQRIAELEEMVELARAYERERIAQYFESQRLMVNTAKLVRGSEEK